MKTMNQVLAMGVAGAMAWAGSAWGASATSGAVTVRTQGLPVQEHAVIGYPPFSNVESGDEAGIWLDGEVLFSGIGGTSFDWQPQSLGEHVLEFRLNGVAVTSKTVNVTSLAFAEEKGPNPPTEADPEMSITPAIRNFGAGGGVQAIVTSGSGTWEASASESWITLNATSGEAGYPVVYGVGATVQVESRTGYVYVNGHVHTVTQDGLGGSITPENATLESDGGTGTIELTAADGVPWQARANCTWVSLGRTSGAGPGKVSFTVAPLNEIITRQGTLTVAGKTFTVFQYGRRTNKISPTQTECDYLAHAVAVTVEALDVTTWRVTSQADWITVEDAGSGQGSGTATLAVAENPSWKARTGTVEIGTETFTVVQEGRTALEFGISPSKTTASVEGANRLIAVTATPDLPWSAKSNKSWLTLDAGTASGAGNGTVAYSIAPNPTLAKRSGRIVVTPEDPNAGAKTNTVTQSAAVSAISTNGYEFAADGGACEVGVSVADIVSWQIQNTNDWLTVVGPTNRVGPGTVMLQAATNETVYPKEGTVTIAKKTFNVSQKAQGVEVEYETKQFGADGGSDELSIYARGQTSWTAVVSDPTWITIWGTNSGTGDGAIMYIVSPNTGEGIGRTGSITIGDKVVRIVQLSQEMDQGFPELHDAEDVALVLSAAVDRRLGEQIQNVETYEAFRAWMTEKGLDQLAVQQSPHAWALYVLGAERLSENEPVIQIDGLAVARDGAKSERSGVAMEVSVTVKDGKKDLMVDAEKVASLFDATRALDDWGGQAKLFAAATQTGSDGAAMQFKVVSGDGTVEEAFLRLALSKGKMQQSISFAAIGAQTASDRVELSATATSGGAITFEVVSGPGVIEGDMFSFTGPGTVVVRALQSGNGQWLPAAVTQTVSVKAEQTISFADIRTQTVADRVELSATSSSGGVVTFEVVSGPGVIEGNMLSFTGSGKVMVQALQAGNELWLPASVTQTMVVVEPNYMVVDLSAGANASSYPVTYMAESPSGGFNTDEYKTTKLVLRRIEPETFMMGGSVQTTLSQSYYIGLFEVTQKQYQLVTGSNPSSFSGDKLPVEQVSWNTIRGDTSWPISSVVSANSFMGRLRARTGMVFDLPTEAQWEYACRAGTTTDYSYGGSANGDYMWYLDNASMQTHDVGTKLPNPWGLYDMHGNVWEWCLDWYGGLSGGTDPMGSSSGADRVKCGGDWESLADWCTSSSRSRSSPSYANYRFGFRLVKTQSE